MVAGMACPASAEHATEKSFLHERDLAMFVFLELDIGSFQSSPGPHRSPGDHHFADIGMRPSSHSYRALIFDEPDWRITLTHLTVGDFNDDGIMDIKACFLDQAKHGTYDARKPLLLTRYHDHGPLIAIAFSVTVQGGDAYRR